MKRNLTIIIIILTLIILILISFFIIDIFKLFSKDKTKINLYNDNQNIKKIKVGLITGFGGLGDKSFNDMQYNGLILAKKLWNIDFEYFCPQNFDDIIKYTQVLIDNNCELIIIGEGYIGQKILDIYAPKYENVKFVVLDNNCENLYKNSASILFKQNEASFLAGVLSGKMTRNNSVGFIGGADIDVIHDFETGYEQGVKYINSNCKIEVDYISNYIKDFEKVWDNPSIASDIAKKMINTKKVDLIFAVSAASNMGIFNACKQHSVFAIGVDTDQDYIIPRTIITSVLKNIDQAIIFIIEKVIQNKFESKRYYLGLKENAVGLSPMIYTKDIIGEDIIKLLYQLQKKIIDGELIIKSVFKTE